MKFILTKDSKGLAVWPEDTDLGAQQDSDNLEFFDIECEVRGGETLQDLVSLYEDVHGPCRIGQKIPLKLEETP